MKIMMIVCVMLMSTILEVMRVYLGIPEFTQYVRYSNIFTFVMIGISYSTVLTVFISQQVTWRQQWKRWRS